jgi:glycosyltransferase involved in cell wall biosynthesis
MTPVEIAFWQRFLDEYPPNRLKFVQTMIGELVRTDSRPESAADAPRDTDTCWIMGTTRMLSKREWDERRQTLARSEPDIRAAATLQDRPFDADRPFQHTETFKVSMIASLYKSGRFIRRFLDNIASQSIFGASELIIIDADSPEREWDTIKEYQSFFPNIIYKRINYRISIYEAWNVAVELARGDYLTNTNLDDLRRRDSIELQARMLDEHADVDVVYQDFYYSLDGDLSFDQVAACGFKSELPIISPANLLTFNSPHNAPMWRKSLHGQIGLFDTRYKSAGDWDFWMRCLAAGKTFRKINSPHIAYFRNSQGVSTRPEGSGLEEGRHVVARHGNTLMPRALLQSRRNFYASLGVDVDDTKDGRERSYFDVAQDELRRLGARRQVPPGSSVQHDGHRFAATPP